MKAVNLKAGQRVYIPHLGNWLPLAEDARPHRRFPAQIVALTFEGIGIVWRPPNCDMRVI